MFGKAQLPHNLSVPILHGLNVGSTFKITRGPYWYY